jgi:hypothetical protein
VQAERVHRTGVFEIDKVESVRDDKADGARQFLGHIFQTLPDQIAQLQAAHHRSAHGDRARTDAVFLVSGQIDQLAHAGQRVSQTRYRRSRQPASAGDL